MFKILCEFENVRKCSCCHHPGQEIIQNHLWDWKHFEMIFLKQLIVLASLSPPLSFDLLKFWNLLLWNSKNFHLTELKETLRFAVLNWLNIYIKTSNFHSLLFIWSFVTNIQSSQFSISLGILKNWKVQSGQIFKNPNYPSLCKLGKKLEIQLIGQHFKILISHLFLGLGKIGKYSFQQHSNISIFDLFVNWQNMSVYTT